MSTTSPKPTIVLVHGAWHAPSHMSPLTTYLQSNNYKVLTPTLPSMHASDITKITLTDDIAAVRSSLVSALEISNVLLVAHSYGTLPSSGALESLDTVSRTSSGHSTSVVGFLIIAGLMMPPNNSVLGFFGGSPAPPQDVRGPLLYPRDPPGPGYLFYHDVPFDVAVECIKTLKPQAWAVNSTILPFAGHLVVPTRYLICERDNILPAVMQRVLVDEARKGWTGEKGGEMVAETIETSHSPFLSRTEDVGRWVRRAAGEEGEGLKVEGLGRY